MKTKHRLTKDFQFISADKKIFILKTGTILEEYNYRTKGEVIPVDRDIVDQNPDYFLIIDWKSELHSYMKTNKLPQPAQLAKKIIPFIEEMVLSSIQQGTGASEKDLAEREIEVERREKRLADREEEAETLLKRAEKRIAEQKEDLKDLEKKEDALKEKAREIAGKRLELEDYAQDLNERERNLSGSILKSSAEIDSKYAELQKKIDADLADLSEKERQLEAKAREISKREEAVSAKENEMSDRVREIEESKFLYEDLKRLDGEIKQWESQHWKLKKSTRPPSAEE